MVRDSLRILAWWRSAERARRTQGVEVALNNLRPHGLAAPPRSSAGRRRLRRLIYWLDRLSLRANCLRRVLLEVALDPESAAQPVWLGLRTTKPGRPPRIGHAWLADDASADPARYDGVIRLDPPTVAEPATPDAPS